MCNNSSIPTLFLLFYARAIIYSVAILLAFTSAYRQKKHHGKFSAIHQNFTGTVYRYFENSLVLLIMYMLSLGVALTGGTEGVIAMGQGDGTDLVRASNVLDDYTYIILDGSEQDDSILFHCSTGLGPTGNDTNDVIGDLYYNNMLLPDGECNGFIQAKGAVNVSRFPGVYQACVCGNGTLNTSTEGVYTCTLTNSSMMDQSVRIGLYLSGRSESLIIL